MEKILPDTEDRVKLHTCRKYNKKIEEKTVNNIVSYVGKSEEEILERIRELDSEWDVERVLETNAAAAIVLSTILGITVNKKWFILTGAVGGSLLQHALQGWCPPLPILRKLGVRTISEINEEKRILQNLLY